MKKVFHGSGVILVGPNEMVLAQLRDEKEWLFYSGCWAYPQGSVEKGENPKTTALRELEEEVGYKARVLRPLAAEDYDRPDGNINRRHVFWAVYDGKQEIQCYEGQEIKFVTIEFLKSQKKIMPELVRLAELAIRKSKEASMKKSKGLP